MPDPASPTTEPNLATAAGGMRAASSKAGAYWDEARRRSAPHRAWIGRQFTQHPEATDETYMQHLLFTVRMSARLVSIGFLLLVHGLFPFLFTRTASHHLDRVWRIMARRKTQVKVTEADPGSAI